MILFVLDRDLCDMRPEFRYSYFCVCPFVDLFICASEYLCIWTFVLKLALCIWRRGTLHIPLYRTIASHWWTFCLGRFFSQKKVLGQSIVQTWPNAQRTQPFSNCITHSTAFVQASVSSPLDLANIWEKDNFLTSFEFIHRKMMSKINPTLNKFGIFNK